MTGQVPAHRSYSQISTYLSCGKQYQLQRIVRVPETPAFYLAGGSAVHDVIEHLLQHPETDPDGVDNIWRQAWDKQVERLERESGVPTSEWRAAGRATKDKPNKEDGAWWLEEGRHMVHRFTQWYGQALIDGWQLYEDRTGPWIERGVNVTVGGAPVKMFLDAVFVMPGGELCVVDWKTGSRVPNDQQVRLYALGMDRVDAPRPSMGAYWMARTGQLSTPSTLPEANDPILDAMFRDVDAGIKAGLFPPHVSSMCGSCGVNRYCAAFGGGDAAEYDPILVNQTKGVR